MGKYTVTGISLATEMNDATPSSSLSGAAKYASDVNNVLAGISASEIKMIKRLAGNDPDVRKKTIRKLKKFLIAVEQHIPKEAGSSKAKEIEGNFLRIWKALFYCMWMADKPIPQEQLAEHISDFVLVFVEKPHAFFLFYEWFLRTLAREWNGIDRFRLDKFMMLFRRVLRKTFVGMDQKKWKNEYITGFNKVVQAYIFNHQSKNKNGTLHLHCTCPLGLQMHYVDVFLEELAKIGGEELKSTKVIKLLKPFIIEMSVSSDDRLLNQINERIFEHLMKQSDAGIEYQESQFFGNGDHLDPEEDSDEENRDNENQDYLEFDGNENIDEPFDPRAGAVDVFLPQLNVNYENLTDYIIKAGGDSRVSKKNRGRLFSVAEKFRVLLRNKYPLALPNIPAPKRALSKKEIKKATTELVKLQLGSPQKSSGRKLKKQRRKEAKKKLDETCGSEDTSVFLNDNDMIDHLDDNYLSYVQEQMDSSPPKEDENEKKEDNRQEFSIDEMVATMKVPKKRKGSLDSNDVTKKLKLRLSNGKTCSNETKKQKQMEIPNHDTPDLQKTSDVTSPVKNTNDILKVRKRRAKSLGSVQINDSKELELKTPTNSSKCPSSRLSSLTLSAKKRVNFVLARNKEHEASDYMGSISKSPAIPFDAERTPTQGVLKTSGVKSGSAKTKTTRKRALEFF